MPTNEEHSSLNNFTHTPLNTYWCTGYLRMLQTVEKNTRFSITRNGGVKKHSVRFLDNGVAMQTNKMNRIEYHIRPSSSTLTPPSATLVFSVRSAPASTRILVILVATLHESISAVRPSCSTINMSESNDQWAWNHVIS